VRVADNGQVSCLWRMLRAAVVSKVRIVGLLAAVALGLLWVRSHYVLDRLAWFWESRQIQGGSGSIVYWRHNAAGIRTVRGGLVVFYEGQGPNVTYNEMFGGPHSLYIGSEPIEGGHDGLEEFRHWGIVKPWGFGHMSLFRTRRWGPDITKWDLAVPDWLPLGLLCGVLLAPTVWRYFRTRRRRRRGLCVRCGYDLRATPGRCPGCRNEMGVAPRKSAKAACDVRTDIDTGRGVDPNE
jgi:hypothetical protein